MHCPDNGGWVSSICTLMYFSCRDCDPTNVHDLVKKVTEIKELLNTDVVALVKETKVINCSYTPITTFFLSPLNILDQYFQSF